MVQILYKSFIFVIIPVIWIWISFRVQLWPWETVKIIFFIQSFYSLFTFSSEFYLFHISVGNIKWLLVVLQVGMLSVLWLGVLKVLDILQLGMLSILWLGVLGAEDAENSVAGVVVHFGAAFLVGFVNFHPSPPHVLDLLHIWGSMVPMCNSL